MGLLLCIHENTKTNNYDGRLKSNAHMLVEPEWNEPSKVYQVAFGSNIPPLYACTVWRLCIHPLYFEQWKYGDVL